MELWQLKVKLLVSNLEALKEKKYKKKERAWLMSLEEKE